MKFKVLSLVEKEHKNCIFKVKDFSFIKGARLSWHPTNHAFYKEGYYNAKFDTIFYIKKTFNVHSIQLDNNSIVTVGDRIWTKSGYNTIKNFEFLDDDNLRIRFEGGHGILVKFLNNEHFVPDMNNQKLKEYPLTPLEAFKKPNYKFLLIC